MRKHLNKKYFKLTGSLLIGLSVGAYGLSHFEVIIILKVVAGGVTATIATLVVYDKSLKAKAKRRKRVAITMKAVKKDDNWEQEAISKQKEQISERWEQRKAEKQQKKNNLQNCLDQAGEAPAHKAVVHKEEYNSGLIIRRQHASMRKAAQTARKLGKFFKK